MHERHRNYQRNVFFASDWVIISEIKKIIVWFGLVFCTVLGLMVDTHDIKEKNEATG